MRVIREDPAWLIFKFFLMYILGLICIGLVLTLIDSLIHLYRRKNSKGIYGKHILALTEDGIEESTDYNKSLFTWESVSKVKLMSNYLLVNLSHGMVFIIPKSAFSGNEELNNFIAFVKSHI